MTSRRDFLQKISFSAAAIPFLSVKEQQAAQEERYDGPVLRVAIMGLGSYANTGGRGDEGM